MALSYRFFDILRSMAIRALAYPNLQMLNSADRAWDVVPEHLLLKLAHFMPERLRKVIAAGGRSIEYQDLG
jgi:hypothetical protein